MIKLCSNLVFSLVNSLVTLFTLKLEKTLSIKPRLMYIYGVKFAATKFKFHALNFILLLQNLPKAMRINELSRVMRKPDFA